MVERGGARGTEVIEVVRWRLIGIESFDELTLVDETLDLLMARSDRAPASRAGGGRVELLLTICTCAVIPVWITFSV